LIELCLSYFTLEYVQILEAWAENELNFDQSGREKRSYTAHNEHFPNEEWAKLGRFMTNKKLNIRLIFNLLVLALSSSNQAFIGGRRDVLFLSILQIYEKLKSLANYSLQNCQFFFN
jgi:hypothetical protein